MAAGQKANEEEEERMRLEEEAWQVAKKAAKRKGGKYPEKRVVPPTMGVFVESGEKIDGKGKKRKGKEKMEGKVEDEREHKRPALREIDTIQILSKTTTSSNK